MSKNRKKKGKTKKVTFSDDVKLETSSENANKTRKRKASSVLLDFLLPTGK